MKLPTTLSMIALGVFFILNGKAEGRVPSYCERAFDHCDFQFDTRELVPTFSLLGKENIPFTARLVSKNIHQYLGDVKMEKEGAEVVMPKGYMMISKLQARPSLTSKTFDTMNIPGKKVTGLSHAILSGSQRRVLRHKCIRIYFSEFQLLDYYSKEKRTIDNAPRRNNKCAVFMTN